MRRRCGASPEGCAPAGASRRVSVCCAMRLGYPPRTSPFARRQAGAAAPGASLSGPVEYLSETFTEAERARLAPHVSDLDAPVFALLNLPETVKGALFARYSRYPGTLRRLFLDEFADSVPEVPAIEGA